MKEGKIVLTSLKSISETVFTICPPINLDSNENYEIALQYAKIRNEYFHLTEENNKLQIVLANFNESELLIELVRIPPGFHTVKDINEIINQEIREMMEIKFTNSFVKLPEKKCEFTLIYDSSTSKCFIRIKGKSLRIHLGIDEGIGPSLGFPNSFHNPTGLLYDGDHESSHPVTIIDPPRVYLHCDLVDRTYSNNIGNQILSSVSVSCPPGHSFGQKSLDTEYVDIKKGMSTINSISITIKNRDRKEIRFPKVDYTLHIQQK